MNRGELYSKQVSYAILNIYKKAWVRENRNKIEEELNWASYWKGEK